MKMSGRITHYQTGSFETLEVGILGSWERKSRVREPDGSPVSCLGKGGIMKWDSKSLTDEEDLELHRRGVLAIIEGLRLVELRERRRIPFWKRWVTSCWRRIQTVDRGKEKR